MFLETILELNLSLAWLLLKPATKNENYVYKFVEISKTGAGE
jgi:hypothetical protein